MDVFEELVRLRNLGQKCALATIVEVRGSIPSYETAKLLVREDGSMVGIRRTGSTHPGDVGAGRARPRCQTARATNSKTMALSIRQSLLSQPPS